MAVQLEAALERLAEALRREDMPLWEAPKSSGAVDELEAAISPMRLPADVAKFWREVDVDTVRVISYPRFTTPEFALRSWERAKRDNVALEPLALVLVGYQSHGCMSVELEIGDLSGGALFEWFIDSSEGFTRRFNALGDWLAYLAAVIEEELTMRVESERGPWLRPFYEDAAGDMLPTPETHPHHGSVLEIGRDIAEWPEHWQRVTPLREE